MRRHVVHDDTNPLGLRVVDVNEIAHTDREVFGCASIRDLRVPPCTMRVDEHEDVRGPVANVLIVLPRRFAGRCRDGDARLADELPRRLVEADDGVLLVGLFGV